MELNEVEFVQCYSFDVKAFGNDACPAEMVVDECGEEVIGFISDVSEENVTMCLFEPKRIESFVDRDFKVVNEMVSQETLLKKFVSAIEKNPGMAAIWAQVPPPFKRPTVH